jgi:hypothetical protein
MNRVSVRDAQEWASGTGFAGAVVFQHERYYAALEQVDGTLRDADVRFDPANVDLAHTAMAQDGKEVAGDA